MEPARILNLVMTFVSGAELAGLFWAFQTESSGWEPLWVLGVECFNYFLAAVKPGAGDFELTNGATIPWLRYFGWLVTCPVLLMFLVSMTTYGGRNATVRLVPLLICNQCMILTGISASAYDDITLKWVIYMIAIAFGGVVLTLSARCLATLYELSADFEGTEEERTRGRRETAALGGCFIMGWFLFPVAYTLGEPGVGLLSGAAEEAIYMIGDILAKNLFAALACLIKQKYLIPLYEHGAPHHAFPSEMATAPALAEASFSHRFHMAAVGMHGAGGPPDNRTPWGQLADRLNAHDATDTIADGAAAKHSPLARHEAARKMVSNHEVVLNDLTRSDGPPASQPRLERLPGRERDVDLMLKECARRLIGRLPEAGCRHTSPTSAAQAGAWAAAAAYLTARLQTSQSEVARCRGHTQRKPDMSPAAGDAFTAVLAELAHAEVDSLKRCSWGKLMNALDAHHHTETVGDGAAAAHAPAARHEAARKLVGNHAAVHHDLTRADSAPTQKELVRLPGRERDIDLMLRELARRLTGRLPEAGCQHTGPESAQQAEAWKAAAAFLSARLHTEPDEVRKTPGFEHRSPDMSPAAGAAFRAVLAEMAGSDVDASTQCQDSSPPSSFAGSAASESRPKRNGFAIIRRQATIQPSLTSIPPPGTESASSGYTSASPSASVRIEPTPQQQQACWLEQQEGGAPLRAAAARQAAADAAAASAPSLALQRVAAAKNAQHANGAPPAVTSDIEAVALPGPPAAPEQPAEAGAAPPAPWPPWPAPPAQLGGAEHATVARGPGVLEQDRDATIPYMMPPAATIKRAAPATPVGSPVPSRSSPLASSRTPLVAPATGDGGTPTSSAPGDGGLLQAAGDVIDRIRVLRLASWSPAQRRSNEEPAPARAPAPMPPAGLDV